MHLGWWLITALVGSVTPVRSAHTPTRFLLATGAPSHRYERFEHEQRDHSASDEPGSYTHQPRWETCPSNLLQIEQPKARSVVQRFFVSRAFKRLSKGLHLGPYGGCCVSRQASATVSAE